MDDETLFPAGVTTPGQAQSRRAYHDLLTHLNLYVWWQDFQELVARGWDWRKAIYIAWSASPAVGRVPETQSELATRVLGLTSDRTIRNWHAKQGAEIDAEIARMQAAPLLKHRRDLIQTTIDVGLLPNKDGHQDRKLAFQLLGDLDKGKSNDATETAGGGPLTLEEWRQRRDRNLQQARAALAAAGADQDTDQDAGNG